MSTNYPSLIARIFGKRLHISGGTHLLWGRSHWMRVGAVWIPINQSGQQ